MRPNLYAALFGQVLGSRHACEPLQAWFWHDEMGDLDIGVFDWCGFQRAPFVMPLSKSAMPMFHTKSVGGFGSFATAMLVFTRLSLEQRTAWPALASSGISWDV